MSRDTKEGVDFSSKVCSNKVFGVIGVCGVVGNLVARVLMDNWYKVVGTDIKEENNCKFKYTLKDYHSPLYFGGHPETFLPNQTSSYPLPVYQKILNFLKP